MSKKTLGKAKKASMKRFAQRENPEFQNFMQEMDDKQYSSSQMKGDIYSVMQNMQRDKFPAQVQPYYDNIRGAIALIAHAHNKNLIKQLVARKITTMENDVGWTAMVNWELGKTSFSRLPD